MRWHNFVPIYTPPRFTDNLIKYFHLQLAAHIVKQDVKTVRGMVESCNKYDILLQLCEIIRAFMLSIKYKNTAIDLLEAVMKRCVPKVCLNAFQNKKAHDLMTMETLKP